MSDSMPCSEQTEVPLGAMVQRVQSQHWPASVLYVVATPIGNLADLSLRAWYALRQADVIAAEDTRSTRVLLDAWGIGTPLMAAHRHNERQAQTEIIERLAAGQRVALVSDAGAPGVSDPGGYVVQGVRAAGFQVMALPGPSAVITALMSVGTTTDAHPAFCFLGFLPPKSAARLRMLRSYRDFVGTLVMFEAPHRLKSSLSDLLAVFGPERAISLARELTKRFEETASLPLKEAIDWVAADAHREQGEYVLLVHPPSQVQPVLDDDEWPVAAMDAWMDALLAQVSTRDAAKIMAHALNLPKDRCYKALLARSGQ